MHIRPPVVPPRDHTASPPGSLTLTIRPSCPYVSARPAYPQRYRRYAFPCGRTPYRCCPWHQQWHHHNERCLYRTFAAPTHSSHTCSGLAARGELATTHRQGAAVRHPPRTSRAPVPLQSLRQAGQLNVLPCAKRAAPLFGHCQNCFHPAPAVPADRSSPVHPPQRIRGIRLPAPAA